jgi:hypothetical protein
MSEETKIPLPDISGQPRLYQWARNNSEVRSGKDVEGKEVPVSHNAICARMKSIHVSDSNLSAFYHAASQYCTDPTFLSEIATPEHILFFDLDIYISADDIWTNENSISTVSFFASKVAELLNEDEDTTTVVITAVTPLRVQKNGDDMMKVGVHFYFPTLFVDAATHNRVRSYLLVAVTAVSSDHIAVDGEFAGFLLKTSWSDVLDKNLRAVRLLVSSKPGKCGHNVEERKRLKCHARRHKVNTGRVYAFVDILKQHEDNGTFLRHTREYDKYISIYNVPGNDSEIKKQVCDFYFVCF